MPRFDDEGYYDRHWDQFEGEDECDCYWLAGGDDTADVECRHCGDRRRAEDRAAKESKERICAVIRIYLDRASSLRELGQKADNFAQLFHYLIDQHEFLAVNAVFREAVRAKALEYRENAAVSFICGRMLTALDRLQIYPGYVMSRREEGEMMLSEDYVPLLEH